MHYKKLHLQINLGDAKVLWIKGDYIHLYCIQFLDIYTIVILQTQIQK